MSVGHGGHGSKHTGIEKVFILEYLEAKFQDAVDWYNEENKGAGITCQVFDPYNTGMDFFILINTTGENWFSDTYGIYEKVHQEYQSDNPHRLDNFKEFEKNWRAYLNSRKEPPKDFKEIWNQTIGNMDRFHASSSDTTLFYSIEQVSQFYATDLKEKGWRVSRARARIKEKK